MTFRPQHIQVPLVQVPFEKNELRRHVFEGAHATDGDVARGVDGEPKIAQLARSVCVTNVRRMMDDEVRTDGECSLLTY